MRPRAPHTRPLALVALAGTFMALLSCSEPESSYRSDGLQPLPPAQGTKVAGAGFDVGPIRLEGEPFADEDWRLLKDRVQWGVENRLDTLFVGDAVAAMGLTFVGWPYTPGTLDPPGPERLVVNLREFDCVTFVENVLALTAFVRSQGAAPLEDRREAEELYRGYLAALRYRGGTEVEYEYRLHYFSEWITDNARRGHLELLAEALGAVEDDEPIDFMSTHPDAYRQLADPAVRTAIRRIEGRLNAGPGRLYLPERDLGGLDDVVRPGDVIAATSTVAGLDVAHTGLAVSVDGRIHLLHAPLVGDSVEISVRPLAERIAAIGSQDGIMAARPIAGRYFGGRSP